jgi:hypothetical protein
MAAHFRALADAEPLASLRRLAAEHHEVAAELAVSVSQNPVPEDA